MMRIFASCALVLACLSWLVLAAQAQTAPAPAGAQPVVNAKPGDIRILAADFLRAPLEKIRGDIEKAAGHPLVIEYGESYALMREMESGQAFELALVTREVANMETGRGKILTGAASVARLRVGVFLRGDVPAISVATPEALNKALKGAKSVSWAENGAAEATAVSVLSSPQVADFSCGGCEQPHSLPPAATLKPGEYELRIDIVGPAAPPYVLVGEIPLAMQVPVIVSAGVGAHGDAQAARAVAKYLMSPAFTSVLDASGLAPPT